MASVASWLPFVRATAIGWVPVAQKSIPPTHLAAERLHTDEKVWLRGSKLSIPSLSTCCERKSHNLIDTLCNRQMLCLIWVNYQTALEHNLNFLIAAIPMPRLSHTTAACYGSSLLPCGKNYLIRARYLSR